MRYNLTRYGKLWLDFKKRTGNYHGDSWFRTEESIEEVINRPIGYNGEGFVMYNQVAVPTYVRGIFSDLGDLCRSYMRSAQTNTRKGVVPCFNI